MTRLQCAIGIVHSDIDGLFLIRVHEHHAGLLVHLVRFIRLEVDDVIRFLVDYAGVTELHAGRQVEALALVLDCFRRILVV